MKRVYIFTLLSVVFLVLLTGCGGGDNNVTATTGSGQVQIQTGDAVNDQVVKFELTISSITLTGVSPTVPPPTCFLNPAKLSLYTRQAHLNP